MVDSGFGQQDRLPEQPTRLRRARDGLGITLDTPSGLSLSFAGLKVDPNTDRHINVDTGGVELKGVYTNTTIDLDNSMTAAEIQTIIDNQARYIERTISLIFQFADGTYTLNQKLDFRGFYGGGNLFIRGNTGESGDGLHTDQAVILDFSGSNIHGVVLYALYAANAYVQYLHVKIKTDTAHYVGLELNRVNGGWINGCYFEGTSTTKGRGIEANWGLRI